MSETAQRWREPRTRLTGRELQILRMVADGKTIPEMSKILFLGVQTIKTYLGRMHAAWNVHTRSQLIAQAFHRGVLTPDPAEITGPTRPTPADRDLMGVEHGPAGSG